MLKNVTDLNLLSHILKFALSQVRFQINRNSFNFRAQWNENNPSGDFLPPRSHIRSDGLRKSGSVVVVVCFFIDRTSERNFPPFAKNLFRHHMRATPTKTAIRYFHLHDSSAGGPGRECEGHFPIEATVKYSGDLRLLSPSLLGDADVVIFLHSSSLVCCSNVLVE